MKVNIDSLKESPFSASVYDHKPDEAFIESVRLNGILVSIWITEDMTIISGHRRVNTCKILGIEEIEAEIREYSEVTVLESNRYREKTWKEKLREAEELERILKPKALEREKAGKKNPDPKLDQGRTLEKIADKLNISHGTLHKVKVIAEKKPELLAEIDKGEVSVNKAYQSVKPYTSNNSGNDEWNTPLYLIEAARKVMGEIDCDPASNDVAQEYIKAKIYYTIRTDGLEHSWHGNIWMNPPFSRSLIKPFTDLLIKKYCSGEVTQACVLVHNATETSWFQAMLRYAKAVCFLSGRVRFVDTNGQQPNGAPLQGQAILYFGNDGQKFSNAFSKHGIVLWTTAKKE